MEAFTEPWEQDTPTQDLTGPGPGQPIGPRKGPGSQRGYPHPQVSTVSAHSLSSPLQAKALHWLPTGCHHPPGPGTAPRRACYTLPHAG